MHFRFRFIYTISFFIFLIFTYCLFYIIFTPKVPIHVMTKLMYEPGHDIENAELCSGADPPRLLIGVISAPKNIKERNAIRATWGNRSRRSEVAVVFFVGKSQDVDENLLITEEALRHSDIVRSNNVDSYNYLTLKTISFIEWANRHCSNARFVMKCDDDVFVNVPNLLSFVNVNFDSQKTIFGELGKGLGPLWWPPKWYISSAEYGKEVYPDFVFGPAYLISSDCLPVLYRVALKTEFFRLEDVFITGIVAETAGIKRVGTLLFIRRDYTHEVDDGKNFNLLKEAKMRISIHGVSPSEQNEIQNYIADKG